MSASKNAAATYVFSMISYSNEATKDDLTTTP